MAVLIAAAIGRLPWSTFRAAPRGRRSGLSARGAAAAAIIAALLVGVGAELAATQALRERALADADTSLTVEELRDDIDSLPVIARAARRDAAAASAAQRRFALVATAVPRLLDRLAFARSGIDPAGRALLGDARRAIAPALDRLRRRSLAPYAGGSSASDGAGDDDIVAPPRAIVATLALRTSRSRVRALGRLDRAERRAALLVLLADGAVLIGMSGVAWRLSRGRARAEDARGREALETSRLGQAITHMRDGVGLFDAADRLVLRNQRFAELVDLPGGGATLGMPFAAIAEALAGGAPNFFATAPMPNRPLSATTRIGDRVLDLYRTDMPAGGHMLLVADVTRRSEAERALREAQHLDVLGRMTGGIAHDFNNLLQAMSANVDLTGVLARAGPDAARLDPILRATAADIERGLRLTRHLLAVTRRQELVIAPVDTVSLLRSIGDTLARTLGDAIALRTELASAVGPVLGDRAQLEDALLNVALNARDAMPDGGVLTVSATDALSPDGSPMVRIAMADTGVGMVPEQIERATEPFYTTKSGAQGTGLGLSVVHGYVARSGGTLVLSSEPGKGTVVTLLLPRAPDGACPDPAAAMATEPGRGEIVLLVEDDRSVLDAVAATLDHLGFAVATAENADAAWSLIENGLRPQLLFSDVMMPGRIDVAELIRRARLRQPELPVLLNTGDLGTGALRAVVLDERTRLLGKPWRLGELSRLLRTLLPPDAGNGVPGIC